MTATPKSASGTTETHRLCVFDLSLDCGHIATVATVGWYPVWVACCDRLGATWFDGQYIPWASDVEFVQVLTERYEQRQAGTRRDPDRFVARRPRTDEPRTSPYSWGRSTTGRFPQRVGAAHPIGAPVIPATRT